MQALVRPFVRALPVLGLALAGSLAAASRAEAACVSDPYIASICLTAAAYCPHGYLDASGQLLPIAQNTALFSLIGTRYGGDGKTTFGLPQLNGNPQIRPPLRSLRYCIAVQGLWPPQ